MSDHDELKLEAGPDGFILRYRNRIFVEHSRPHPCVEIGRGVGRFRFFYGLFKIRDRRIDHRPCRDFAVAESGTQRVVIDFPVDRTSSLQMTLESRERRLHMNFAVRSGAPEPAGGVPKPEWNRLRFHWAADPDEQVYGGGEQYSRLNLRRSRLPVWVQEPGLGRGFDLLTLLTELKSQYGGRWYTTYFSQPTFVFTSGAWLHSDSSAYTEGDFRRRRRHTLTVWNIPASLVFGVEPDPKALMNSLTSWLGRQPRPPAWTWDGMWLGAIGGRKESLAKLERMRGAGVRVSALWCQDWEGIRITSFGRQLMWNWKADPSLYPDLRDYTRELAGLGVRFLGYINPFLALEGDLYAEAHEKGYCVKNPSGGDYLVTITTFPAAMLDLTHPGCREWIKNVIRTHMIRGGLSGWMADFGEYIPTDAVFHDGSDGLTYHNRYVAEWARINREAVEEAAAAGELPGGPDDCPFFMRAGYTGSTRYAPMFWNGDQLVNWSRSQGFPTVIPATLSMGFTGAGYVHSDLGGYTTVRWLKRSRELVLRWAEQAAFTQTMRSHEGNRPHIGVRLHEDEEILNQLCRMTGVFTALKPYHQALSEEYQNTGVPPVRHPWIHFPDDRMLHRRSLQYQYMYGSDLMVAPVIRRGARSRRLYLPEAGWVHLWSGAESDGGWTGVSAPIGEPPVFYRRDSAWRELFESLRSRPE